MRTTSKAHFINVIIEKLVAIHRAKIKVGRTEFKQ
jgi:hypothetical protein